MNALSPLDTEYQHYYFHCHYILSVVNAVYNILWTTTFSSKFYFIKNAQALNFPLSTPTQKQWERSMKKLYVDLLVFIIVTGSQKYNWSRSSQSQAYAPSIQWITDSLWSICSNNSFLGRHFPLYHCNLHQKKRYSIRRKMRAGKEWKDTCLPVSFFRKTYFITFPQFALPPKYSRAPWRYEILTPHKEMASSGLSIRKVNEW